MDQLKLFSIVLSKVKKRLLVRGMILGVLGVTFLFCMGVWGSVATLETWGLLTFALGIFLIGFGLIPYKNLTRLETHPHKLIISEKTLTFISSRGGARSVPLSNIRNISYWEGRTRYGLTVDLGGSRIFLPRFLCDPRLDEIVHPDQPNEGS